jgi:cell division protein FtsQ
MQQRKSKKILIYFFLLLIVGSTNNINFNGLELQKINNVNISGLDIKDKSTLLKKIENFNLSSIFLISKIEIKNEIESNSLVENYSVFKRYPSSLNINIEKTKFLAKINKNGQIFFIGSNGKLIQKKNYLHNQLPFIFGNPEGN